MALAPAVNAEESTPAIPDCVTNWLFCDESEGCRTCFNFSQGLIIMITSVVAYVFNNNPFILVPALGILAATFQINGDVNFPFSVKKLINFLKASVYYLVFFDLWNVYLNLAPQMWYLARTSWAHFAAFNGTVSFPVFLAFSNWTRNVTEAFSNLKKPITFLPFNPALRAQAGLRWIGHTTANKWPLYTAEAVCIVLTATGSALAFAYPAALVSFKFTLLTLFGASVSFALKERLVSYQQFLQWSHASGTPSGRRIWVIQKLNDILLEGPARVWMAMVLATETAVGAAIGGLGLGLVFLSSLTRAEAEQLNIRQSRALRADDDDIEDFATSAYQTIGNEAMPLIERHGTPLADEVWMRRWAFQIGRGCSLLFIGGCYAFVAYNVIECALSDSGCPTGVSENWKPLVTQTAALGTIGLAYILYEVIKKRWQAGHNSWLVNFIHFVQREFPDLIALTSFEIDRLINTQGSALSASDQAQFIWSLVSWICVGWTLGNECGVMMDRPKNLPFTMTPLGIIRASRLIILLLLGKIT